MIAVQAVMLVPKAPGMQHSVVVYKFVMYLEMYLGYSVIVSWC